MAIHRVIMCDTLHLSLVGWHFPVPSSALYYGSAGCDSIMAGTSFF